MSNGLEIQNYRDYNEELDLRKYWRIVRRRWLMGCVTFAIVSGSSVLLALSLPDIYRAEGKVLFKRDRTPALTGLNEDLGTVEKLTFQGNPLDTQVEIVTSSPVLYRVIDRLQLRDDEGDRLKLRDLTAGLTVQPIAGTEILQIGYESEKPEQATAIVNQVIASYQAENVASNQEEVVLARRFIESQLPLSEKEVQALEEHLRRFKEENQIVSLAKEADNTIDLISSLSRDITQLKSQLAGVSARLAEAQRQLGLDVKASLDSARLSQSSSIQTAIQDLLAVQSQIAQQSARYQNGHPSLKELRHREANLTLLLQQRVEQIIGKSTPLDLGSLQGGELRQSLIADYVRLEMERVELVNRIAELVKAHQWQRQRAVLLPTLEKGERELERQLQAAQATYETLLTQLQEVRTAETQVVGNVKVVSIAEIPSQPVAPSRSLIMAAGVILGSLLGLTTVFLSDLFLSRSDEDEQETGDREAKQYLSQDQQHPPQLHPASNSVAELSQSNGHLAHANKHEVT